MKKSILIIVSVLMLGSAAAQQQQYELSDSVLTFKRAIDIALRNNVTLNTQRNVLAQSRTNRLYRYAQLGPNASISGSWYQSNGNRFIQQEGKVVNATVTGSQLGLSIGQPIFNGLSILTTARQSSYQYDAQAEGVRRSTQDVINTVAVQYLSVLLDQELLTIAQENVTVLKQQYDQAKAQVELGSRSPVDEFNVQAQLASAERVVAQAEYQLVNDKVTLFQSLLVDPITTTRVEEPNWDVNAMALDNLSLEQLLATANDQRSDLKQARSTEKASKYGVYAAKGNYLPALNAFYNNGSAYNQVKGADKSDPAYRGFRDQFITDNRSNSFGVSLNIPLFTGFQNRFAVVQSKVLYENNKLQTKNREVMVKGDVLRAYENFLSVQKAYSAGLTGLQASQMAFNLESERYNLGITTFVDFANANKTYVQAQTDMAQAKYRFIFQKVMLDYAAGTLKVEDLPTGE